MAKPARQMGAAHRVQSVSVATPLEFGEGKEHVAVAPQQQCRVHAPPHISPSRRWQARRTCREQCCFGEQRRHPPGDDFLLPRSLAGAFPISPDRFAPAARFPISPGGPARFPISPGGPRSAGPRSKDSTGVGAQASAPLHRYQKHQRITLRDPATAQKPAENQTDNKSR